MHKNDAIIRAWLDGKTIEWACKDKEDWTVFDSVLGDLADPNNWFKYRIAPEKKMLYVNVYPNDHNSFSYAYSTREKADKAAAANRIACIEVEYKDGQGL